MSAKPRRALIQLSTIKPKLALELVYEHALTEIKKTDYFAHHPNFTVDDLREMDNARHILITRLQENLTYMKRR